MSSKNVNFTTQVLLYRALRETDGTELAKKLCIVLKEDKWHKKKISDFLKPIKRKMDSGSKGYEPLKIITFLMAIMERGSRAWQNQAAKFFRHIPVTESQNPLLKEMGEYLYHDDIYIQRIIVRSFGIIASKYKADNKGYLPYEIFESVRMAVRQWTNAQTDEDFRRLGKQSLDKLDDNISIEKQCYHRLWANGFDLPKKVLHQISDILSSTKYTKKNANGRLPHSTLTNLISRWIHKKQPSSEQAMIVIHTFEDNIVFSQLLRDNHQFFNSMIKNSKIDIFDRNEKIAQIAFRMYKSFDESDY